MPLLTRKRLLLAKTEATYGTDSTPTGAANAILVRNLEIVPLQSDIVQRELIRPYLGNYEQLLAQTRVQVTFEVEFSDEDFGYNVGKMKLFEGIIVDSFYPEGGSEEAYELALEIQGDNDYYTWDIFFEVNEDEKELNSFIKTMIGIAYKKEKVIDKDMPLIVLNEFLSLALEKEDYEFATEVRDAIKSKEIVVGNPN